MCVRKQRALRLRKLVDFDYWLVWRWLSRWMSHQYPVASGPSRKVGWKILTWWLTNQEQGTVQQHLTSRLSKSHETANTPCKEGSPDRWTQHLRLRHCYIYDMWTSAPVTNLLLTLSLLLTYINFIYTQDAFILLSSVLILQWTVWKFVITLWWDLCLQNLLF